MDVIYNKKYLFSGYGFDESKGPCFVLDDIFDQTRKYFFIHDNEFTIHKMNEKYCIGSYDLRKDHFSPCAKKNKIEDSSYTLCNECKRKQGFNPAFYNANFISAQQRERNKKEHSVYLASFGNQYVKVGIAYAPRLKRRLLEQGARSALLVKKCNNAYQAREIEEYTHKYLNISETVMRNKKIQLISNKLNMPDIENELVRVRKQISREFDLGRENQVQNFDNYYLGDKSVKNPILLKSDYVSGKGIGMIGSIYISEKSNKHFVIDLHSWIAHIVTIDFAIIDNTYKKQIKQNSLF